MDIKELHFQVNATVCRGANKPCFDPTKFNEGRIPDGMRYKSVSSYPVSDTHLRIDWTTQECYDDEGLEQFKEEARRWGDYNGLTGVSGEGIVLEFNLDDRYSDWTAYFEIQ